MAENSKIEWTDHTFNHVIGCSKVSPACHNCYAERDMDHHWKKAKWGPQGTRVMTADSYWGNPIKWNRDAEASGVRWRVFCASLADVFEDWSGPITGPKGKYLVHTTDGWQEENTEQHESCSRVTMDDVRRRLFRLIDATPNLDWQLLTKRPKNIMRMWTIPENGRDPGDPQYLLRENVWLGVSVESAKYLPRIDALKACGELASVLFLSCEPLLGAMPTVGEHLDGIDWLIAGGESGPNSRLSHPDWFRAIRDQCVAADVKFLFKQWGAHLPFAESSPCLHWVTAHAEDGGREYLGATINGKKYSADKITHDALSETVYVRVGKKAAGRLLDGVTHDGFPVGVQKG